MNGEDKEKQLNDHVLVQWCYPPTLDNGKEYIIPRAFFKNPNKIRLRKGSFAKSKESDLGCNCLAVVVNFGSKYVHFFHNFFELTGHFFLKRQRST